LSQFELAQYTGTTRSTKYEVVYQVQLRSTSSSTRFE